VPANKLTLGQHLRGVKGLRAAHRDILHALASYGNYDLTGIRPAVETVARDHELRPNTVRDTMRDLVAKGLLVKVRDGGGRNRPTEYRIVLPTPTHTLSETDRVSTGNPVGLRWETLSENAGNPVGLRSKTLSENDSQPVVNQFLPTTKTSAPAADVPLTDSASVRQSQSDTATATSDSFEAFFNRYPKRQHKTLARAAFDKLVATGEVTGEELVKRAGRYSAECREMNRDPKYVRMPENWLDHLSDPGKANWTGYRLYLLSTQWGETRGVSKAVYDQEMTARKERERLQKQWS
jgi:hypothetical protein